MKKSTGPLRRLPQQLTETDRARVADAVGALAFQELRLQEARARLETLASELRNRYALLDGDSVNHETGAIVRARG